MIAAGDKLFTNKKEGYVSTPSGSSLLVEVEEHHGSVILTIGENTIHLEPDSAFDLADMLTMVANGVDSHVEAQW